MEDTKRTTLYLPLEVADALKRIADGNRRSFNSEVVIAVEEHIRKEEKRMATDRRAGPRQGPYVSGGKKARGRETDCLWREESARGWVERSSTATTHPITSESGQGRRTSEA